MKPKLKKLTLPSSDDNVTASNVAKIAEGMFPPPAAEPKPVRPLRKPFNLAGTELGEVHASIIQTRGDEIAVLGRRKLSYPRIPTGVFPLDLALAGGFLSSRGHMVYGEKSAGKSTTTLRAAANAQAIYPDEVIGYVDVEGTFDPDYFEKLGGDMERLYHVEPESGEHAIDIADALARTKEISMLITDSIAMLTPMKEIEASAEDAQMGVHARLIGNYLRRLGSAIVAERHRGHRLTALHINQFRMKIGVVFGDPRALPGGKALEFSTSQQVEIKNSEKADETTGMVKTNEHTFKITKDKTGGRYKAGKFFVVRDPAAHNGWPEGTVIQAGSMLEMAKRIGLSNGKDFQGFGTARGKDEWQDRFVKDPELLSRVQNMIIDKYRELWGLAV
jgi:recombination protein RecA